MTYSVIITAYKEPELVKRAIKSVIDSNQEIINLIELILVCGDDLTYTSAFNTLNNSSFKNYIVLRDEAQGKPKALNLAFSRASGDIWVLTDGDIYLSQNSISNLVKHFTDSLVVAVTGKITSLDNKNNFFGYYSNVFCDAANFYREQKQKMHAFFPLSGYLYAFRKINNLVLPTELRAEDDYLSHLVYKPGHKFIYESNAIAFVNFPKNISDLIKQKTRSLGGNVQNSKFFNSNKRSIMQDLKMFIYPLLYAKSLKQILFSLLIYPIRLYLWIIIYYRHTTNKYNTGVWDRIESSKY